MGDFNADGRADASCMSNGKVALSLGRGFLEAGTFGAWCSGSTNFFASDVDGDGASELIYNNPAAGADDHQVANRPGVGHDQGHLSLSRASVRRSSSSISSV